MYQVVITDDFMREFKSPILSYNDAIDYYSDVIKMFVRFDIADYSVELWEVTENGNFKSVIRAY